VYLSPTKIYLSIAEKEKDAYLTEPLSLPSHTKGVRCKPKDVIALYHLHMVAAGVDFTFSSLLLSFLLLNLSTNYLQGFSERQQWWNPSGNKAWLEEVVILSLVPGLEQWKQARPSWSCWPSLCWCPAAPQGVYHSWLFILPHA